MTKSTSILEYTFSMKPDWFQQTAAIIGANLVIGERLSLPEQLGEGSSLLVEILPGLSVLVVNMHLKQSYRLYRLPSLDVDEFWILDYDLIDENSKLTSDEPKSSSIKSKFGFTILDSHTSSSKFITERKKEFSLQILISKSFLNTILKGVNTIDNLVTNSNYRCFFSAFIDSRSKILLNNLKKHSFESSNFKFLLKGTVYNLLGFFLDKHLDFNSIPHDFHDRDKEIILESHEYLLSNLRSHFPGLKILVEMSNMSISKYRYLYKSMYGKTPFHVFREEKMLLAKELLESGNYNLVRDVAFELGYSKVIHFSKIYKARFQIYPCESLKKPLSLL